MTRNFRSVDGSRLNSFLEQSEEWGEATCLC